MNYDYTMQEYKLNSNVFELTDEEHKEVTSEFYKNCTDKETMNFFRCLGGTETLKHKGTKHILTSCSPSRDIKIIRTFIELP